MSWSSNTRSDAIDFLYSFLDFFSCFHSISFFAYDLSPINAVLVAQVQCWKLSYMPIYLVQCFPFCSFPKIPAVHWKTQNEPRGDARAVKLIIFFEPIG
jgi:hypothetical protein